MPAPLPIYNNQTPVNLTDEDLEKALKLLTQIQQNLEFFAVRLQDRPKMQDIHTHMGLLESYTKELSPLVQYDTVLTEEMERRYKEVREANKTIHELERKLGEGVTAEGVSSKLREYDDVIRLWYGAHGFQYASLKEQSPYNMTYDFNYELQYNQDEGCSSRKEWAPQFKEAFGLIAHENDPTASEYDIYYDTYHAELLDTTKNKELIMKLIADNFPNSIVRGFTSRQNDFGSYSMRFTVSIMYTDIEALVKRIIPAESNDATESKTTDTPTA